MNSSTASETPPLFVDTWGWLVLEDSDQPDHEAVRRIRSRYVRAGRPWITTDYVLDETITRLFSRRRFAIAKRFCEAIFQARKSGSVEVEFIDPGRFEAAYALRRKYQDKPRMSFTDLTSFAVMLELGVTHALTADAHFHQAGLGFATLP